MMLLNVIGRPRLTDSGRSSTLRGAESVALAYIALQPNGTSRAELARLIWPRVTSSKAKHSLNQLLYTLRRKHGVEFAPDSDVVRVLNVVTDIELIRGLIDASDSAIALPQLEGRFLEGVDSVGGQLAGWRDDMDSVVSQIAASALQAALSTSMDKELDRITHLCERVLAHHPYLHDERTQLVRAVIRTDNISRARRLYSDLTSESDYDEAVVPFDQFLTSVAFKPGIAGTISTDNTAVRFVGRSEQLNELARDWTEAASGVGCTRVIWGEPGIGKTRLALHFMRRIALSGGRAWTVRCTAATQRLPFSVTRSLIEENDIELADTDSQVAYLLGLAGAEHAQVTDGDHIKHILVRALTDVVERYAASKPLAILIDDAQWADDFTALLLSYWSYRLRGTRVLILLTARTHDIGHSPNWIANDLPGARHATLQSLNPGEALDLVNAFEARNVCTVRDESKQLALRQTGGVPFLLLEALAASIETKNGDKGVILSNSVEAVLGRRFRELPAGCEWLAGLIAVVGRPICAAEIVAFSGMGDTEIAAAITVLQRRGILQWSSGTLQFPHDLMRETAYSQLSTGTRALLHYRVAVLLANNHGTDGIIAQHYAAAGDGHNCGRYSLSAAVSALSTQLYTDAEFYYRMALEAGSLEHRSSAAQGLLRLLLQLGRRVDLDGLLQLIPIASDNATSRLLTGIATIENSLISGATTADLVQHARELAEMSNEIRATGLTTASTTLLEIALDSCNSDVGGDLIEALEKAAADGDNPEFCLQTQAVAAIWEAISKSTQTAQNRLRSLQTQLPTQVSAQTGALIGSAEALIALYAGRLSEALEIYERAMTLAEKAGDVRRFDALRVNWAVVCMELGRFCDAQHAFEMAATSDKLPYRIRAYQNLAALHYELGDYLLAGQAADAVMFHNKVYKSLSLEAGAHAIRGLCALARGDSKTAEQHLAAVMNAKIEFISALDDNSYTMTFIARMAPLRNNITQALDMLASASARKRKTDVLCALRLECEGARLQAFTDTERAYVRASEALCQARQLGATLVIEQAHGALQLCDR